ncbi:MAG: DUF4357 domain-containing protein [Clostridia bacterium]|nr:DUF4357 domain-containing protein [Clostridia bacterium]
MYLDFIRVSLVCFPILFLLAVGLIIFLHVRRFELQFRLLAGSGVMITALWSMNMAVNLYSSGQTGVPLRWFELIELGFRSFFSSLGSFGIDGAYIDHIRTLSDTVTGAFQPAEWVVLIYRAVFTATDVLLPVFGGALLLTLISEFFPKLRHGLLNLLFFTKKYYFSEINPQSLALAKNLLDNDRFLTRIVFISGRTPDPKDKDELIAKAKSIGAVCLKSSVARIHFAWSSKPTRIYLIGESVNMNLEDLSTLLDRKVLSKEDEIYVFSSDKSFTSPDSEIAFIVNTRKNELVSEYKKEHSGELPERYVEDRMPFVIPVDPLRNLVRSQLTEVPLFEPVIERRKEGVNDVTVTILGSGVIGTEFFLNTYWFGQMLGCKLNINVISREKRNAPGGAAGSFEGRINNINPDILNSAETGNDLPEGSASDLKKESGSEFLRVNGSEYADPYFSYKYYELDVLSGNLRPIFEDPSTGLLDTDYFVVALGSDEDNFNVADELRRLVAVHHMKTRDPDRRTLINYVIYNDALCDSLNRDNKFKYIAENEHPDIIMRAFGNLRNVYSIANVMLSRMVNEGMFINQNHASDSRKTLNSTSKAELKAQLKLEKKKRAKDKIKRFADIYKYDSSIARALHKPYKCFSAGFRKGSLFSLSGEEYKKELAQSMENYRRFVTEQKADDAKMVALHQLAWLEHRRWCAYMRTNGFRKYDGALADYYTLSTIEHEQFSDKFISIKLHNDLAECDKALGICADFDDKGKIIKETKSIRKTRNADMLDKAMLEMFELRKAITKEDLSESKFEVKAYDYPDYDFRNKS